MADLMQEREVLAGVNNALSGRINMHTITADAENYAQNFLGPSQVDPGVGGTVRNQKH